MNEIPTFSEERWRYKEFNFLDARYRSIGDLSINKVKDMMTLL